MVFEGGEKPRRKENFVMAYNCYRRNPLKRENHDPQTLLDCCRNMVELGEQLSIRWDEGRRGATGPNLFFTRPVYREPVKHGEIALQTESGPGNVSCFSGRPTFGEGKYFEGGDRDR